MKIYFSASIRAGRDHVATYEALVAHLGQYGEVLTEFVKDPTLTTYGTTNLTEEEIYTKDVSLLTAADVVVADVTKPSLGVGYELGLAEQLGKKVLCLYQIQPDRSLSAMIAGNPRFTVKTYREPTEAVSAIDHFFTNELTTTPKMPK